MSLYLNARSILEEWDGQPPPEMGARIKHLVVQMDRQFRSKSVQRTICETLGKLITACKPSKRWQAHKERRKLMRTAEEALALLRRHGIHADRVIDIRPILNGMHRVTYNLGSFQWRMHAVNFSTGELLHAIPEGACVYCGHPIAGRTTWGPNAHAACDEERGRLRQERSAKRRKGSRHAS